MATILGFMFYFWLIGAAVGIILAIVQSIEKIGKNQRNINNIQPAQIDTEAWKRYEENKKRQEEQRTQYIPPKPVYGYRYQRRQLLTPNEWYQYQKLIKIAEGKELTVFTKIRLLDIIEPRRGDKEYQILLNKIQSKHVDFVLCDNRMNIKTIIELDDSSHDTKNRIERDAFVDEILTCAGYKIIHVRGINEDILDFMNPNSQTIIQ